MTSTPIQLLRKVRGVLDPAVRLSVFAELSAVADASALVRELDAMGRLALARDPNACELVMSLIQPARVFTDPARVSVLIEAAREAECVVALQWLWAAGEAHDAPSDRLDAAKTQGLVDRSLSALTLGDRRALARRATYDQLMRLAGDPDPIVVAAVLANPRTTEAVVTAMCSRRPTVSVALQTVIETPTWVGRPSVRTALAHNPYLVVHAAVPLLVTLPPSAIAAIRDDEKLVGSLRLAASRLLVV